MKRRFFLIFTIIFMCTLVIIGGAITFVKSDSVLKEDKQATAIKSPKDLSLLIDITENKLYVISKGVIIKTYPVASGKYNTPSPIGDWIVTSKGNCGDGFGGRWMGLNVPWATLVVEHKEK